MKTGDLKRLTPMGIPPKKGTTYLHYSYKTNITTGYTENYTKNNTTLHQKLYCVTNTITAKHKGTLN